MEHRPNARKFSLIIESKTLRVIQAQEQMRQTTIQTASLRIGLQ